MTEQFNPWHHLEIGENAPEKVRCVIEITNGSKGKFELDKDSGMLLLDRVLHSSMRYPTNYGFIPKTYCDDKDPLDILVYSSIDIPSMCIAEARVIGVMKMVDGGEGDDKIIAVASGDPTMKHIKDITDMPPHTLKELVNFFSDYKKLEGKSVEVDENLQGREEAIQIVKDSIELYNNTF